MEKDDLLNIQPKQNLKKPIIYGAAAFLVFIIAVIGYAIYSNSTNKNSVVLPPQVNENNSNEKQVKSDFKEIKVEENNDVSAISQKINKDEILNSAEDKKSENLNTQKEVKPKEEIKSETTVKAEVKEEKKEISKPQQQVEKVTEKPKKREKKSIASKGKYYIQVAALLKYKKPNKKFLALIKKEGFNYELYHTFVIKNGQKIPITKILIGPFKDRNSAGRNLKVIKKKLTQNAFLFRMK